MRGEKAFVAPAPSARELSKSSHEYGGSEPQFFSSFVLASGVAGYRLGLGIYRRAHSFLLARHFIRTGSRLSLRFASPRPWAISYKCVVNYLPRGRDTTVLLHRCSSPPHTRHIPSAPQTRHLHRLPSDCTTYAPLSLSLTHSLSFSRLSCSPASSLDRASSLFTPSLPPPPPPPLARYGAAC